MDILLGAPKLSFYDRAEIVHRYNTQPELLAACKDFISILGPEGYYPEVGKTATDKMRQAIVEAEGKE